MSASVSNSSFNVILITMKKYRVNKNTSTNPNGNNEVHDESCRHYYQLVSYEDLGLHSGCKTAVAEAKRKGYSKADGCKVCSPECHNG
jgi:hypothetical protein